MFNSACKATNYYIIWEIWKQKSRILTILRLFGKRTGQNKSRVIWNFSNKLYIFEKQNYKISRCEKKVDVIITDSPLLNSILYNKDKVLGEEFNALVAKVFKSYSNMTYLINRTKPYNPAGRLQTESQADALKTSILSILTRYDIPYRERNGDQQSYDQIANDVILTVKHLKAIRAQNNFSTTKEFKPQERIMNFDWFQEKMQKIRLKN